eukprot:scaffold55737_cov23-Tisochrysis_lutea.AAC.4
MAIVEGWVHARHRTCVHRKTITPAHDLYSALAPLFGAPRLGRLDNHSDVGGGVALTPSVPQLCAYGAWTSWFY